MYLYLILLNLQLYYLFSLLDTAYTYIYIPMLLNLQGQWLLSLLELHIQILGQGSLP